MDRHGIGMLEIERGTHAQEGRQGYTSTERKAGVHKRKERRGTQAQKGRQGYTSTGRKAKVHKHRKEGKGTQAQEGRQGYTGRATLSRHQLQTQLPHLNACPSWPHTAVVAALDAAGDSPMWNTQSALVCLQTAHHFLVVWEDGFAINCVRVCRYAA
jgi:hypothetical protein